MCAESDLAALRSANQSSENFSCTVTVAVIAAFLPFTVSVLYFATILQKKQAKKKITSTKSLVFQITHKLLVLQCVNLC